MAIRWSRRASARSRSMCLNSSNVVDPMTRSSPDVRMGLIIIAKSIVPPVVAPAPTVGVDFVDEQDGPRPRHERPNDVLEALLEVTPEPRAREERARVEGEDFGILQEVRDVGAEEPRREAFGHRRLPDARLPDEDRVVLPAAAEHLNRALQLLAPANQRVEPALPSPLGQIRAVRREGVSRRGGAFFPLAGWRLASGRGFLVRRLRHAVGNELEDVEPRDSLGPQQAGRLGLRLLEHRGQDVARIDLGALGTLDVEDRGLKHASERRRLLGLALLPPAEPLDGWVEVFLQVAAQAHQSTPHAFRMRSPSGSCARA